MSDDPFDHLDQARLDRHERLLQFYNGVPAEEILLDLTILAQITAFRLRQERLVIDARAGVRAGATHDCGEWVQGDHCAVCGQAIVR